MANFRGYYIPSFGATINVAWETLKAKWPENSPCMELIRGNGTGQRQAPGYSGQEQFKSFDEGHEMMTMNGEQAYRDQNNVAIAEDSFSYQRNA